MSSYADSNVPRSISVDTSSKVSRSLVGRADPVFSLPAGDLLAARNRTHRESGKFFPFLLKCGCSFFFSKFNFVYCVLSFYLQESRGRKTIFCLILEGEEGKTGKNLRLHVLDA